MCVKDFILSLQFWGALRFQYGMRFWIALLSFNFLSLNFRFIWNRRNVVCLTKIQGSCEFKVISDSVTCVFKIFWTVWKMFCPAKVWGYLHWLDFLRLNLSFLWSLRTVVCLTKIEGFGAFQMISDSVRCAFGFFWNIWKTFSPTKIEVFFIGYLSWDWISDSSEIVEMPSA